MSLIGQIVHWRSKLFNCSLKCNKRRSNDDRRQLYDRMHNQNEHSLRHLTLHLQLMLSHRNDKSSPAYASPVNRDVRQKIEKKEWKKSPNITNCLAFGRDRHVRKQIEHSMWLFGSAKCFVAGRRWFTQLWHIVSAHNIKHFQLVRLFILTERTRTSAVWTHVA